MKNFFKKHFILISLIILFIPISTTYINNVKYFKMREESIVRHYYDYCLKLSKDHEPECEDIYKGKCLRYDTDVCDYLQKNINNKKKITYDTMHIYGYTTVDSDFYITFISPIILLVSSLYFIYELFKSKIIINIIQRKGYKKTMKQNILKCYRYIWFIPLISLIILFLCFLASGHFDSSYAKIEQNFIFFDYSMNQFIYYILLLAYMIFFSIFFINIGLIVLRKNHNFIVVIIETFLIFIGIDILTEVLIGQWLCYKVYGYVSPFSILKTIQFILTKDIIYYVIYMFLLALITFIIVILKYKNKEKFIIDCEKNL